MPSSGGGGASLARWGSSLGPKEQQAHLPSAWLVPCPEGVLSGTAYQVSWPSSGPGVSEVLHLCFCLVAPQSPTEFLLEGTCSQEMAEFCPGGTWVREDCCS